MDKPAHLCFLFSSQFYVLYLIGTITPDPDASRYSPPHSISPQHEKNMILKRFGGAVEAKEIGEKQSVRALLHFPKSVRCGTPLHIP